MKKSISLGSLIFPNQVVIIGTYDEKGAADMTAIAWAGVACSEPAAISIAVRPSRYSHENLKRRGAFTVNLPSAKYAAEADYFGLVSGRDTDKIAAAGLTAVKGEFVDAPYLAEFPYVAECEVTQALELGSHTLFIGALKDIRADEEILVEQGRILWDKAGILTFDGAGRRYLLPGAAVAKAFSAGLRFRR